MLNHNDIETRPIFYFNRHLLTWNNLALVNLKNSQAIDLDILNQLNFISAGNFSPIEILELIKHGQKFIYTDQPFLKARTGIWFGENHQEFSSSDVKFQEDFSPLLANCLCYTCQNYTRAYLYHLENNHQLHAQVLHSIHNLFYYDNLFSYNMCY